jgi:hypothetical protein
MSERQLAPARNNKTKENNMIDIDSLTIGEARRLVAHLRS